jgi:hypothetical protein
MVHVEARLRWTGRIFPVVVYLLLVATIGCERGVRDKGTHNLPSHDLTESVPDRSGVAEKGPPKPGEDFAFVFAVGGNETGYCVLRIDSDGQCTYEFPDVKEQTLYQKRLAFEVTGTEMKALCDVLAETRFAELDVSYAANVVDGTQLFIKCEWEDASKLVYCDNHFPDEAVNIHDYIFDQIIAVHVDQYPAAKEDAEIVDELHPRAGVEDLFIELTKRREQG